MHSTAERFSGLVKVPRLCHIGTLQQLSFHSQAVIWLDIPRRCRLFWGGGAGGGDLRLYPTCRIELRLDGIVTAAEHGRV